MAHPVNDHALDVIFRDARSQNSFVDKDVPEILIRAAMDNLISMDEPGHMQMRIQQKDFFVPAYVAKLREKVRAKVEALCDDLEAAGPVCDFVKLFSNELPLYTLCEMLGVDEADRPKIVYWMHYLEMASQFLSPTP